MTYIYAYKGSSESAKNLAEKLGATRIKHTNSRFKGDANKTVINWGASSVPAEVLKCRIINNPASVAVAANKRMFFQRVDGRVNIPAFTTSTQEALEWLRTGDVCIRHILTGHAGNGLEIASMGQQTLPDAPLYTQYIKKKAEYRIHVLNGEVIDYQQKKLRRDWDGDRDTRIRNHDNGYVFARTDVDPPANVIDQAVRAIAACELDFGGVDVIWNQAQQAAYVLEVNSAPGIEGTTVQKYKEAFERLLNE